jgi:hypothetical protein
MAKTSLSAPLKQAILCRNFYLGVVGTIAVIFISSIPEVVDVLSSGGLLSYGFHDDLISGVLVSDSMILSLPILCALPFTASFIDDIKSGFIKAYLPRTTTTRYLWGKSVACALSGGLVVALGIVFSYALSALIFLPMEATPVSVTGAEQPDYLSQLMGNILLFFLSGAFWSMVGLLLATLTNSRYMAYIFPFIIYYVLIILHERYFDKLYVMYPKEWLNPSEIWPFGNVGVALLLAQLIIITGICFAVAAKRRLRHI